MDQPDEMTDAALDRGLRQALSAPALPPGFRERLRAALARDPGEELMRRRQAALREHEAGIAALARDSVSLRLKTLGTLIGGAFAAGVALTLAMPWIREFFAPYGNLALGAIGVAIAAGAAFASWSAQGASPGSPR
jgi:hypothetical protein